MRTIKENSEIDQKSIDYHWNSKSESDFAKLSNAFFSWWDHYIEELTLQPKRKFIDKKTAKTFRLVSRSRSDPLYYEEGSTPNVLVPKDNGSSLVLIRISANHFIG